jgi:hypothetical protein
VRFNLAANAARDDNSPLVDFIYAAVATALASAGHRNPR